MRSKKDLEQAIISLIQSNDICGQSQLQALLHEQGYDVPQATLSRYFQKLHIAKVGKRYQLPGSHTSLITNIQVSDIGLIVIHTLPGHANGIAFILDQNEVFSSSRSLIMGTIAGDDTILIIPRHQSSSDQIMTMLEKRFHFKRTETF